MTDPKQSLPYTEADARGDFAESLLWHIAYIEYLAKDGRPEEAAEAASLNGAIAEADRYVEHRRRIVTEDAA